MQRKVRLLFVIDSLGLGGTERQLLEIASRLAPDRFDLFLCSLREPERIIQQELPSLRHVKTFSLPLRTTYSWRLLSAVQRLKSFIHAHDIDIVQAYFPKAQLVGLLAGKLAGVHTVGANRDLGFNITLKNLLPTKLAYVCADTFLANSPSIKHHLVERHRIPPTDIHVITNGVDLDRYHPPTDEERQTAKRGLHLNPQTTVVGTIANLRPVKGLVDLISAAAIVREHIPNIFFIVVGDGPQRQDLERQATTLDLRNHILFAGSRTNVLPYLHALDIGVLCSHSEGFSNAILEYMAVGLPIIATHVGGTTDQIRHGTTGLLVPPNNPRALATSIITLALDTDQRTRLGRHAYEHCQRNYDIDKMVTRLEEFYLSLGPHSRNGRQSHP